VGDFISQLIGFVVLIWDADVQIRDQSVLGESPMERDARKFIAWFCGGIIFLLVVAGVIWWWTTKS
jgi:hypothetical protein